MTDVIGLEFEGLKNAELKIGGPNEKISQRVCCIQVDYRRGQAEFKVCMLAMRRTSKARRLAYC